jgi:Fe(3+) dicitrate transport protein
MQLNCIWTVILIAFLPALGAASVAGRVVDHTGTAVPGARVIAEHPSSGATMERWTDTNGRYEFDDLRAGGWDLRVTKDGFEQGTRRLATGETEVDFRLRLATLAERIVVTGALASIAEQTSEIPGSVDVLGPALLTQARVFNFDEALRKAPGVHIRGEEGFGLRPNIGIRGLNPTRSTKVLLLEDGIPLTFAPYGANESYYHPPVERFESIEVVKGAGQILYGPQTIGGVINYLTPQPPQQRTGSLTLIGGNRDYLNGRMILGGTIARSRTGLLLEAMRKQGEGARENLRHGLSDFNLKAFQPLSSRHTLSGKFNYWLEDSNVTYSGLRLSEWEQNPRGNPFRNDYFNLDRTGASLTHAFAVSPDMVARTSFYGYVVERNWWRQSSNSGQRPNDAADPQCGGMANLHTNCGNEGRLRHYAVWGIEPRVRTQQSWLGVRNDLEFGFRAHFEEQDRVQQNGDRPWSRSGSVVENNQRRNQAYSGFLQNRFNWGKLSITPGVRLEHVRYQRLNRLLNIDGETNLTKAIPGIGASYSPAQHVVLFTGLHRGFAPPRTEDIINNTTGGVVDLDPELSWNYEAGIRGNIRAGSSVAATYFRMSFENQIIPANLAGGIGAALTSAGSTDHHGMELSGTTQWKSIAGSPHSLSFRGAYTWMPIAEFTSRRFSNVSGFGSTPITGNRLPYAPRSLLNAQTIYTHSSGLNALVEASYIGRQFGDDLNTVNPTADGQRGAIPSTVIWNATLNYPIEQWRTTVFVTAKNLFDRLYLADRVRGMIPGSPRLLQAGLQFRF